MPKVSVLMPSFNYAQYLPCAIRSVLSQSYSDLELVIIDDCSTDGSKDVVTEWSRLDARVVSIFHTENRGLAVARNSGMAASSGELVALCDADDIWLPDKLKSQVECFQKEPELGVVHSDSAIIDSCGHLTGQLFSDLFHTKRQKTSGYLFEELCKRNFICVPTVLLRREALEYATGFNATLRSLEDWACWAMISRQYPFCYVNEPLAQYRIHPSNLSSNSKGMAQNRLLAIRFLLDSLPEVSRQSRAGLFYSLGASYLELDDFRNAVEAFVNSIREHPTRLRSWVRFCESSSKVLFFGNDDSA